ETVLFRYPPRDSLLASASSGMGTCAVGPDGKLYFSHGDWFTRLGAQNLDRNNPAGKIHRVNLDGTIPDDNPRANDSSTMWCNGFRFPFGFCFDPAGSNLWIGDRGNLVSDEIDRGDKGANYGYPIVQGAANTNFEQMFSLSGILYRDPIFDFGGIQPLPGIHSLLILPTPAY